MPFDLYIGCSCRDMLIKDIFFWFLLKYMGYADDGFTREVLIFQFKSIKKKKGINHVLSISKPLTAKILRNTTDVCERNKRKLSCAFLRPFCFPYLYKAVINDHLRVYLLYDSTPTPEFPRPFPVERALRTLLSRTSLRYPVSIRHFTTNHQRDFFRKPTNERNNKMASKKSPKIETPRLNWIPRSSWRKIKTPNNSYKLNFFNFLYIAT